MDASGQNYKDTFRYTDVEYTPDGHTDVYRWDDFLGIAGGLYDPVGGCGGTMGTVLDRDFEIDPHDIAYTMMEPVRGEWKSDRIDLYTPQDCFGFSDPFGGRIEYSEKKPEIAVAVKPDPVELGHRASVAASSTAGDRARGAGIRQ